MIMHLFTSHALCHSWNVLGRAVIGCALGFTLALTASAQTTPKKQKENVVIKQYEDSLLSLKQKYQHYRYTGADTLSNPYYFFLLSRPTYYEDIVKRAMALPPRSAANRESALVDYSARLLAQVYGKYPSLIRYNEATFSEEGLRKDVLDEAPAPTVSLAEKAAPHPDITPLEENLDLGIVAQKPNFWAFKTNFSLQFMQTYVSDNWYKGGESNYSVLGGLIAEANYDNKQKLLFSNTLELKLGFQSSRSDTEHKYKTNTDLIRMTNKLGIQASKHWYYTLMLQSWTQFYKGYKRNDRTVYSDFMSPFESLLSLGMDYKLEKKRLRLTATLSPLAVNFIYVARRPLITTYGLKENHHTKFEFGSNITVNGTWEITPDIVWMSRAYLYTDYSRVQIEWENTFQFKINKYLSSCLFLYPRFDDSYARQKNRSHLQFSELFSLGLDLSF